MATIAQARSDAGGPAASRYASLRTQREPFLRRARRVSRLTIPSLFREEGDSGDTDEIVPWQSFGAYAVRNLANKIRLTLFPAGIPWIRLKARRAVLESLQQLDPSEQGLIKSQIGLGLRRIEGEFVEGIEEDGDGAVLADTVLHLVNGGNHAIEIYPDSKLRGIPLQQYVTWRDPSGKLLEFVIEDPIDFFLLDDDVKTIATDNGFKVPEAKDRGGANSVVKVYTHGYFDGRQWNVYQEVQGQKVPGSEATWNEDALPYLFLMFEHQEAEHYGRSYTEHFEGDLQTVDGMEQLVQESSAVAAMLIRMVRPGGTTSKKAIEQALNGAVISGNPEDVSVVRNDKNNDLAAAADSINRALQRLSRAFLLNSAVTRDAERVTAREIMVVAQELEDQLGASYSNQVVMFQAPYARLKLRSLERQRRVTPVPQREVSMTIITGAAALGRGSELQLLDAFLGGAQQIIDPAFVQESINPRVYMNRRAAALGVDVDGLVLTEEEVEAKRAEAQSAALSQAVAPEAVRQVGQALQQQGEPTQ